MTNFGRKILQCKMNCLPMSDCMYAGILVLHRMKKCMVLVSYVHVHGLRSQTERNLHGTRYRLTRPFDLGSKR